MERAFRKQIFQMLNIPNQTWEGLYLQLLDNKSRDDAERNRLNVELERERRDKNVLRNEIQQLTNVQTQQQEHFNTQHIGINLRNMDLENQISGLRERLNLARNVAIQQFYPEMMLELTQLRSELQQCRSDLTHKKEIILMNANRSARQIDQLNQQITQLTQRNEELVIEKTRLGLEKDRLNEELEYIRDEKERVDNLLNRATESQQLNTDIDRETELDGSTELDGDITNSWANRPAYQQALENMARWANAGLTHQEAVANKLAEIQHQAESDTLHLSQQMALINAQLQELPQTMRKVILPTLDERLSEFEDTFKPKDILPQKESTFEEETVRYENQSAALHQKSEAIIHLTEAIKRTDLDETQYEQFMTHVFEYVENVKTQIATNVSPIDTIGHAVDAIYSLEKVQKFADQANQNIDPIIENIVKTSKDLITQCKTQISNMRLASSKEQDDMHSALDKVLAVLLTLGDVLSEMQSIDVIDKVKTLKSHYKAFKEIFLDSQAKFKKYSLLCAKMRDSIEPIFLVIRSYNSLIHVNQTTEIQQQLLLEVTQKLADHQMYCSQPLTITLWEKIVQGQQFLSRTIIDYSLQLYHNIKNNRSSALEDVLIRFNEEKTVEDKRSDIEKYFTDVMIASKLAVGDGADYVIPNKYFTDLINDKSAAEDIADRKRVIYEKLRIIELENKPESVKSLFDIFYALTLSIAQLTDLYTQEYKATKHPFLHWIMKVTSNIWDDRINLVIRTLTAAADKLGLNLDVIIKLADELRNYIPKG